MATKDSTRSMTEGNIYQLILEFAIPLLLGTLFQQLYSMVDTVIVGRFLGVEALAGVGSTGAINFMINGFVIGSCSGFAIPVAQRFGASDHTGLRKYLANIVYLTTAVAVVMTIVIGALTKMILHVMNTPESIFSYAYTYILIIFLGIPVTFLYNMTSSVIRSLGDAKTPVYFLILASVMNIFLDLFTIVVLHMNVDGPAISTVISQGVSGFLCLIYMIRRFPVLHIQGEEWKFDGRRIVSLMTMGFPMGLQYSITAIGSVILQTAVNGLGPVAVASVTAGEKTILFCSCVFDALGATMATFAGQNEGALKFSRIKEGVLDATKIGAIYSVAIFIVLVFFGGQIPKIFVGSAETEVIRNAHRYLVCNSGFYILLTIVNVWRFSIQGMGFSGFAVLAGVCEMAARGLVGFLLVPIFGFPAVCFASPLAWVFADCFLIPGFFHCLHSLERRFKPSIHA
jgi:putative MATE family efflux protein